ncbi:MAG: TetR family transcriptional regulator C-terminal domain-containing protein [Bacteroidia bacterium]|nr:TetR family transcriptional regulator C-terminal domain-containing protein [Bacteroidia bacterium]MDW8346001.1 hypothetical protein [Bacteroidia bacterium]
MEKVELLQKYIDYVSKQGERPSTVSKLTFAIGIKESDFYTHFSSLKQIEQFYWTQTHQTVVNTITQQEVYANYSVREKLLSYAFTLIEFLKQNRSFVQIVLKKNCDALKAYKQDLKAYVEPLITEGTQKGEIEDRMFLTQHYSNVIIQSLIAILYFWIKDESTNFEKTDVYVEKSINFIMDILHKNWIDTGLDFLKYQFKRA